MGNESAPQVHWKRGWETCQSRDEVAFPGVDCLFGGVGAMIVRWNKLEVYVFAVEEAFEGGWTFVVTNLHFWFQSAFVKVVV